MKKIILLFALILSIGYVSSQKLTLPAMADGQTYMYTPTDYSFTNTVGYYFTQVTSVAYPATQDFIVKLDSVSGNHTNVAVSLYGVKSLIKGDSTIIGSTVNWKGTTRDTIIVISNATANRYRAYKWNIVGTGTGVSKVLDTEFKIRYE